MAIEKATSAVECVYVYVESPADISPNSSKHLLIWNVFDFWIFCSNRIFLSHGNTVGEEMKHMFDDLLHVDIRRYVIIKPSPEADISWEPRAVMKKDGFQAQPHSAFGLQASKACGLVWRPPTTQLCYAMLPLRMQWYNIHIYIYIFIFILYSTAFVCILCAYIYIYYCTEMYWLYIKNSICVCTIWIRSWRKWRTGEPSVDLVISSKYQSTPDQQQTWGWAFASKIFVFQHIIAKHKIDVLNCCK